MYLRHTAPAAGEVMYAYTNGHYIVMYSDSYKHE